MDKILKQITNTKVHIEMSLIEALELKNTLEKQEREEVVCTDSGEYKCLNCGVELYEPTQHYCHFCGQRLRYEESDVIPL